MQRFKNILCVVASAQSNDPAWIKALKLADKNGAQLTVCQTMPVLHESKNLTKLGVSADLLMKSLKEDLEQQQSALINNTSNKITLNTKVIRGTPFLEIIREVLKHEFDLVIKTVNTDLDFGDHLFGSDDMHLLRKCPCPVWLTKPHEPRKYKRIIAAIDVDDNCEYEELVQRQELNQSILTIASSLAMSELTELYVVHAWEAVGESLLRHGPANLSEEQVDAYVIEEAQHHQRCLERAKSELKRELGNETFFQVDPKIRLLEGRAQNVIPRYADKVNAELVVMGTVARSGIPGFFIGNTAENILNKLSCAVLAIKPPGFVSPVTINK